MIKIGDTVIQKVEYKQGNTTQEIAQVTTQIPPALAQYVHMGYNSYKTIITPAGISFDPGYFSLGQPDSSHSQWTRLPSRLTKVWAYLTGDPAEIAKNTPTVTIKLRLGFTGGSYNYKDSLYTSNFETRTSYKLFISGGNPVIIRTEEGYVWKSGAWEQMYSYTETTSTIANIYSGIMASIGLSNDGTVYGEPLTTLPSLTPFSYVAFLNDKGTDRKTALAYGATEPLGYKTIRTSVGDPLIDIAITGATGFKYRIEAASWKPVDFASHDSNYGLYLPNTNAYIDGTSSEGSINFSPYITWIDGSGSLTSNVPLGGPQQTTTAQLY